MGDDRVDPDATDDGLAAAWQAYCDALKDLGTAVLASPHAVGPVARAEGIRHLARLASMGLTQRIEFSDPTDPVLFRSNDDVWQWGGPNVDNVYLGAPLDPSGTYRLTGELAGQPGVILQVLGQPTADDPIAVRIDCDLAGLADEHGRIDVVLSGDAARPADLRLPADGRRLMLREYVPSTAARRAGFTVERLDAEPDVRSLDPHRIAADLAGAQQWLAHNVTFWQDYTAGRRDEVGVNCIEAPNRGPGMGSDTIAYSAGFYDLADDECLLVTVDDAPARYWALQLYSLGWYEALDVTRRQTSLNHTESHVDPDGRVRFVIAAADPGVPNWLDATGHPRGMFHYRAVWCDDLPSADAEVVPVAELRRRLPDGHPTVTPEERRDALRARRSLARHRFAR